MQKQKTNLEILTEYTPRMKQAKSILKSNKEFDEYIIGSVFHEDGPYIVINENISIEDFEKLKKVLNNIVELEKMKITGTAL
jgi:hypothetical protein